MIPLCSEYLTADEWGEMPGHVLTSALTSAATTEDLFRLWDMTPTRRWFEVAAKLSDLSAYEFAKLQTF